MNEKSGVPLRQASFKGEQGCEQGACESLQGILASDSDMQCQLQHSAIQQLPLA
jgi:hypothetical protein